MHIVALIFVLLQVPDPQLRATRQGADSAILSWTQPPNIPLTCLYRYYGARWPAAVCYHNLKAGVQTVELPGALLHPAYTPSDQDTYILEFNGEAVGSATLGEAVTYRTRLPLMARTTPRYTVRLARV